LATCTLDDGRCDAVMGFTSALTQWRAGGVNNGHGWCDPARAPDAKDGTLPVNNFDTTL